jgi:hypothetical protein
MRYGLYGCIAKVITPDVQTFETDVIFATILVRDQSPLAVFVLAQV